MTVAATEPAIEAADLTVRRGGRPALRIDSLTVPGGTTVALVGPNGSGKSTFLHAVAGLVEHTGRLQVLGRPASDRAAPLAYVLQAHDISPTLPITVREAVSTALPRRVGADGRRARRDAIDAALDRVELLDLADRRLRELSGGQRQRVLSAQGLLQPHELLLLDEPTAGLDLASMATVDRVVHEEHAAGRTIVVATHDLGDAADAELVVLLAGRVVAAGPPAEVLTAEHLAEAYRGRLLTLGGTVVIDDGAHHDHERDHGHDHDA